MPAYYRAPLGKFVSDSTTDVNWQLALENGRAKYPLTPEAIQAWELQLPSLQDACQQFITEIPQASNFEILLEYPIPRVGKRIDAVILMHDIIVVIETKTGLAATAAERQVDDYAIHLACFHEPSAKRTIVPVVVSDAKVAAAGPRPFAADDVVRPCRRVKSSDLSRVLADIAHTQCNENSPVIEPSLWDNGVFNPYPQSLTQQ